MTTKTSLTILEMQRLDKIARDTRQQAIHLKFARQNCEAAIAAYIAEAIDAGLKLSEAKGIVGSEHFSDWLAERLQHIPKDHALRWLQCATNPDRPILKALQSLDICG